MDTKKLLTFTLIGVILAGVVFGAVFFFMVYSPNMTVKATNTYEYSMADFTTNLGAVKSYFRGSIVVETTNKRLIEEFEAHNAELRDAIIQILISKKPEDLLDISGQQALREEIKAAIGKVLTTDEITNVYFIDYIVQ
ncbi:flagellar basal body-associated FliL family protein [Alkaliphilus crotonatoxidans]